MGNNSTDDLCIKAVVETATDGYRIYAMVYVAVNLVVIAVSLVLWLLWRRRSSHLLQRSFPMILLLTFAFICDMVTAPLSRVSGDEESILNNCVVIVFSGFMIVPTLVIAQGVRVMLFLNRYNYNKSLSDSFKASNFRGTSFSDASSQLSHIKKRSEAPFGIKVASGGMIVAVILALIHASQTCPELGLVDKCEIESFSGNGAFLGVFIMIGLLTLGFIFYVRRKVKQYPDPFRILNEIYTGYTLCFTILVLTVIIGQFDIGNFHQSDPLRFDYGLFVDIGFLVQFYYSVPYQLYLAMKPIEQRSDFEDVTLEKVLDDDIGKSLFRQHLITEFSVENLNFAEAAQNYIEMFKENASRTEIVARATNIFHTFIAPNAPSALNIASSTASQVRERFGNREIYEDLFNVAYFEILELMEQDSFLRFQLTDDYKAYIGSSTLKVRL